MAWIPLCSVFLFVVASPHLWLRGVIPSRWGCTFDTEDVSLTPFCRTWWTHPRDEGSIHPAPPGWWRKRGSNDIIACTFHQGHNVWYRNATEQHSECNVQFVEVNLSLIGETMSLISVLLWFPLKRNTCKNWHELKGLHLSSLKKHVKKTSLSLSLSRWVAESEARCRNVTTCVFT